MAVNSKFKIPEVLELFKSLKNAQSQWKLKTPMQKWCYFFGIGRAAYRFIRFPLLNDVNHEHWFAYLPLGYGGLINLFCLNSIHYYAVHGQLEKGLLSTCAATLFTAHAPMLIAVLFNKRFELQSLIDFGGRYIYFESHEKTDHNRICSNHMDRTMEQFIIKMGSIFVSFSLAMIGPVYAYMKSGILTTTVETHIPFTEPKSTAEVIGNCVLQLFLGVHGIFCYIGLECFLSILENVVTVTPRLIKSDLEQTIQLYEKKSITQIKLNLKIANIVKQSNDADKYDATIHFYLFVAQRILAIAASFTFFLVIFLLLFVYIISMCLSPFSYVGTMSKLFYWRNLFTPACFTYMIGVAIFCQYTMGYAAGYGMACMSWIQLFYVCEFGEKIQDNGFAEMLYQIKWEALPLNVQKAIMLLIHRKQNEEGLSLGPFGMGINRETFKLATNKIYTFGMFLKNFFV